MIVNEINVVAPVTISGVSVPGSTTYTYSDYDVPSSIAPTIAPFNDNTTIAIALGIVAVVLTLAAMAIIAILVIVLKLCCNKRLSKVQQIIMVEMDPPQPISHHQSRLVDNRLNIELTVQELVYVDLDKKINSQGAPRPVLSLILMQKFHIVIRYLPKCYEWFKTCTLKLDSYVLFNFLHALKDFWKDFGVALSLSDHLDSIETKYSANDQRLQQVLISWYENPHENKPFTWDTLDRVLRSIKVNGASILANEVAKTISTSL